MERNEVSIHEVRIYQAFLAKPAEWLSAVEIAELANVAPRTARAHTSKLTKLGILDLAEVFPAHRYRLSEKASKRNVAYLQRLIQASEVFGVS